MNTKGILEEKVMFTAQVIFWKLTCTMFVITLGSMDRGNRMMLNSDNDTNAFSASSTLFESDRV